MYTVKVFRNGECIDERDFEYGTWKEIAYFLDHFGYIDSEYKVEVTFS